MSLTDGSERSACRAESSICYRSFDMLDNKKERRYRSLLSNFWSGREDLNLRPPRPERGALPSCATPRLTAEV